MLAVYLIPIMSDRRHDSFFLHGGTVISWKASKQILVASSTNISEITALYEASRECVWLLRMINHIQLSYGIGSK